VQHIRGERTCEALAPPPRPCQHHPLAELHVWLSLPARARRASRNPSIEHTIAGHELVPRFFMVRWLVRVRGGGKHFFL
jgi:hypothetical protein